MSLSPPHGITEPRFTSVRIARRRFPLLRFVPSRCAQLPVREAKVNSARSKFAPRRLVKTSLASIRFALCRFTPVSSAQVYSIEVCLLRLAPLVGPAQVRLQEAKVSSARFRLAAHKPANISFDSTRFALCRFTSVRFV